MRFGCSPFSEQQFRGNVQSSQKCEAVSTYLRRRCPPAWRLSPYRRADLFYGVEPKSYLQAVHPPKDSGNLNLGRIFNLGSVFSIGFCAPASAEVPPNAG